ncbi:N-formylglutamate amidohydrolase [Polymorphobacter multimanifer]|uniref:N-formylglutamate deformylase n=1 Tax=Polymorphobacter multimanifer TaxID=1070431 RepID=A0A841LCK0_9SPHN|nr:N-formylglutamate amidohydrolase [Polymorphobacter multimanifer]MBB6229441.1 N-formylglutamate deformylase [Polymorphobacter multimanifer]GGI91460.1 N-formylglutamate amidohydrolase [Polymorphobacter multimanifer]
MDDSLQPGFSLTGDDDGRWPVVLASPHSGRDYPASFLAASPLSLSQLRRAEDAFVDHLLDGVSGVPILRARWSRLFLDLNRAANELDPAMFDGRLPVPVAATDRVACGLGVLPRIAGHGLDVYRCKLPMAEAARRLAALHLPWHSRLTGLLHQARARHGFAVLVDCHSMPRPSGAQPPQIVLGDRHGRSAHPALVTLIEQHFQGAGLRVARNNPYAGGYTTEHHGQPAAGIHAVQIEIDRSLYMDPARLTLSPGFATVARQLQGLVRRLVTETPSMRLAADWREAAE